MTVVAPVAPAALAVSGTTVELVGVVKDYSGQRALDGVDLRVEPGEFVALLGPSGCGKTTALRVLAGLERIDEGHVRIGGEDVGHVPVHRRDIGMVFQSYSLFPHMTVAQNVAFGLQMRRAPQEDRQRRVAEGLEMVGLTTMRGRYAHQLSGGQQQRVALARALVTRPRVLLLDEPLSALDARVRVQLRDEIRRIQQELGITTLFVTHDQEEALAVADRVAVMNAGTVEQIGSPEELYLRPATPFVAGFVGLSNLVEGRLEQGRVTLLGTTVDALPTVVGDGPVLGYVRPEHLAFEEEGLPGSVISSSFLGAVRHTVVRLEDDVLLVVQHDVTERVETGAAVHLSFTGRAVAVAERPHR